MNREDAMTRSTAAPAMMALALTLLAATPGSARAMDRSDTTWICLAPASVEENSGNTTQAMDAVRETFTGYLTGPSLAAYPLKAKLASQFREEARQAGCPYTLLTTLKHVQKKSGGSVLGKMAAGAAQQGAYEAGVATGSTAGRVVGQAASGAAGQAAYNYATAVHNKEELTLEYRLESSDGMVLVEKEDKRKAKSDGEDLLTPMVQQASEAIAAAVTKS
jgi:hypothetical protein